MSVFIFREWASVTFLSFLSDNLHAVICLSITREPVFLGEAQAEPRMLTVFGGPKRFSSVDSNMVGPWNSI